MVYDPTLFNIDPYYDDFDESKNFLRLLFRPSYAVQARELTQLQTLLQNQIERFGNNVFYDGSMVMDGQITENRVYFARLTSLSGSSTITDYTSSVLQKGTTGPLVRILHVDSGLSGSSVDTRPVIYFNYISGSSLTAGDVLSGTASDVSVSATIAGLTGITGSAVGSCILVNVNDGVRYIDGFFVRHDAQSLALYDETGATGVEYRDYGSPTVRVGFDTARTYVSSSDDTSLQDPAFGSYNYAAPGANRYKIDLTISQYPFTPTATSATDNFSRQDFVEFLRVVDGDVVKKELYPDYSVLEDTLARRTYDESGNYTVRPFDLSTIPGASNSTLYAKLEAGKAYIFGYEFETQGSTKISVDKARSTRLVDGESVDRSVGPYLSSMRFNGTADSIGITFATNAGNTVYLASSTGNNTFTQIGTAKIRHVNFQSGNDYYVYLHDISFTGSNSEQDIKSIYRVGQTASGKQIFQISSGTTASFTNGGYNNLLFETNYSGLTSVTDLRLYYWAHTTVSFDTNGYATVPLGSFYDQFVADETPGNFPQSSVMVFTPSGASLTGTLDITGAPEQLDLFLSVTGPTFGYVYYEVEANDVADIRTKTSSSSTLTLTAGAATLQTDENNKKYITLGTNYDVVSISHITGDNGTGLTDMTSWFSLDTGQRDNYYDWARIVLNPAITGFASFTGPYSVSLTRYSHSGYGPLIVNSYPVYESIPDYTSETTGRVYKLRDVIDFRPYKDTNGTLTGCAVPSDNSLATVSYNHYLPRTDKIVLTRDRQFSVIQGTPSIDAIAPADDADSMTLYTVTYNPYTFDENDVTIRYVENKRYTMRDIGKLEKRIDNLEYYTSLSVIEQEAKSTAIYDEFGLDRPKLGILVDTFKGHNIGDVLDEYYQCSIDYENSALRPKFVSSVSPVNYASIVLQAGITYTSDKILLSTWTSSPAIVQTVVTDSLDVNNTGVFNTLGKVIITPSTDAKYDSSNEVLVKVNVEGENDNWAAPSASGNGFGTQWNDWELNWLGKEIIEEQTSRSNSSVSRSTELYSSSSSFNISNRSTPETIRRSKLNRYVNENIVPWMRSRSLSISAEGLKPNTGYYPYFDGSNVSAYCSGSLTSDSQGRISGLTFSIPSETFRTGQRLFRLTDHSGDSVTGSNSAAETVYYAKGFIQSREDGIVSVVPPIIRRESVNSENIVNNILTRRRSRDGSQITGYVDPLAQTFTIDSNTYPDGIYCSKVGILFKSKETQTSEPVILQLRPLQSGFPHPSKIIPFSEVYVYPSAITTSTDGSTITDFTFSTPVYLPPGDYAVCLLSSSENYQVYTAKAGSYSTVDVEQRASKNAMSGYLFKPQNSGIYSSTDNEDLCYIVYKCIFSTSNVYADIPFQNDGFSAPSDINVDYVRVASEEMTPSNTTVVYSSTSTKGLANGSYSANRNIQSNNTATRAILSGGNTEPQFRVTYTCTEDVSPQIDLNRLHVYSICNLINSNTSTANTAEGNATPIGATAGTLSRYITKSVELDDTVEATNVNVYLNAYKPIETTIQVWVRYLPFGLKTGIADRTWTQLQTVTSSNSTNENDYVELHYNLAADISRFGVFQVKIVFATTDSSKPPIIRNMRTIVV